MLENTAAATAAALFSTLTEMITQHAGYTRNFIG